MYKVIMACYLQEILITTIAVLFVEGQLLHAITLLIRYSKLTTTLYIRNRQKKGYIIVYHTIL